MPKTKADHVRNIIVLVIACIGIFSFGYLFGSKGYKLSSEGKVSISRENPANREDLDFALFWEIWDNLESRYYDKDKIDKRNLVYGAIQGMVSSVGDPYTVFLPPDQNKVVQEDLKGSFDGVGIQIGFRGNQLAVIAPLPDSPAETAGVKPGDLIIGILDKEKDVDTTTTGMTLPEAVELIRGPKGSMVTLAIMRDGLEKPELVDIKRGNIDVPSLVFDYLDENGNTSSEKTKIAHVRIIKFTGEMLAEWQGVVADILKDPNIEGIILDVRNNPGGYLNGAIELSSEFLEIGDVVVVEESGDGKKEEFGVERIGRLKDRKMVVLINEGSASASEILAGALRDNLETPLVGETTFGKGTIQEPQQVEGGAGLHVTIAKWLTPKEIWVNEVGLEPDYIVEDDPETEADEQIVKAIEILSQ